MILLVVAICVTVGQWNSESQDRLPPKSPTEDSSIPTTGVRGASHSEGKASRRTTHDGPDSHGESDLTAILDAPPSRAKRESLYEFAKTLTLEIGVREAVRHVQASVGAGRSRSDLIAACIAEAREPLDDTLEIISAMEYEDDHSAALHGLVGRIRRRDLPLSDIASIRQDLRVSEAKAIIDGAASAPPASASIKEKFRSIAPLLETQPESNRKQLIGDFLESAAYVHPGEALDLWLVDGGDRELDRIPDAATEERIFQNAFHVNPGSAIRSIERGLTSENGVPPETLSKAVRVWASRDLADAAEWAESAGRFGETAKSAASIPFLRNAVEAGDSESAQLWLAEIHDLKLREQARKLMQRKKPTSPEQGD